MTALYTYTCQVYDKMLEQAVENIHAELVFTGKLTDVFRQIGVSQAYYTAIRSLLLSPDLDPCIEIYQRGNSSQPSIIRLHHPPSEDWKNISQKDLTAPREGATLLAELEARVNRLEAWRESIGEVNLSEALVNHERRITSLEGKREG